MHLCCLGLMRRLLNLWVGGDLAVRLPSRVVSNISRKLQLLHSHSTLFKWVPYCPFNTMADISTWGSLAPQ